MKNIFTITLLLASFGLFAQTLHKDRAHVDITCGKLPLIDYTKVNAIDTLFCERLNYDQTQFDPYTRSIFVYDDLGRIVSSEYGYYTVDGLRLSSKYIYTYTSFDSIDTYTGYFWNDTLNLTGDWDVTNFTDYTYNNDNQLVSELVMFNPIGDEAWVNRRLFEYQYEDEKLVNIIHKYHDIELENWRNYMKIAYTYEDGQLATIKTHYTQDNGENWNDNYIYVFNYSQNQKEKIEKHFNGEEWRNMRKHTYDLDDNGDITADLEERWSSHDSIWDTLILEKKEFGYDNQGNMTSFLHRSAYIEWFNVAKEDYFYLDGQFVEGIQYNWDWNEEEWFERVICNIKTTSGILSANEPTLANQVSVYPNPALEDFTILIPNGLKISSIKLYDVGGKTIEQFEYMPQRINMAGLEKGLYFVTINLEGEIITKKLVKQ